MPKQDQRLSFEIMKNLFNPGTGTVSAAPAAQAKLTSSHVAGIRLIAQAIGG